MALAANPRGPSEVRPGTLLHLDKGEGCVGRRANGGGALRRTAVIPCTVHGTPQPRVKKSCPRVALCMHSTRRIWCSPCASMISSKSASSFLNSDQH